jgi:hypothetical protein
MTKQTPVPANENDLMTAQQAKDFVNCFAPVYLGKEASYVTSTGGRLMIKTHWQKRLEQVRVVKEEMRSRQLHIDMYRPLDGYSESYDSQRRTHQYFMDIFCILDDLLQAQVSLEVCAAMSELADMKPITPPPSTLGSKVKNFCAVVLLVFVISSVVFTLLTLGVWAWRVMR